MDYIAHNGELYHYGVKGMKWGVRQKQTQSVKTTNAQKVKERQQEMRRLQNEYKLAKRAYKMERNKLNEQYEKSQPSVEKIASMYGIPQRINRYMNDGDSIASARIKTYAQVGATVSASYAMIKFMKKHINDL